MARDLEGMITIITIGGDLGSGKSTARKLLAQQLHYQDISNGDLYREMAKERGVTPLELARLAEHDTSIDKAIDDRSIELGKTKRNFIVEGRLGFHFIRNSYKVNLTVDPDEGARRVYESKRRDERENTILEKTKEALAQRHASELKRFKEKYGVDPTDPKNYDLTIDTTSIPAEEVAKQILDGYLKKLQHQARQHALF